MAASNIQVGFCGRAQPYAERGNNFEARCGSTASRLVQCERCGYCRFDPIPGAADLDAHYHSDYAEASAEHYDLEKEYSRPDLPGVANHLIDIVRQRGCTAYPLETHDYGCALGNLVHALRAAGASATGHDINRQWVELAKPLLGEAISHQSFAEIFHGSSRQLHLVTMLHVLEHTPQPLETMLEVRARLAPSGIVYIFVPNALFLPAAVFGKQVDENFMFPTHLHYFTPQSIVCLLRAAGLRPLHIETRPGHFSENGRKSFLDAAAQQGSEGPEAFIVEQYAHRFRTAELFILACRDDSGIPSETDIDARVSQNAPFEQPLWRRVEQQARQLGPHSLLYVAADTPIERIFEWSTELSVRRQSGRLKLLDEQALAPSGLSRLVDSLSGPETFLLYICDQDAADSLLRRVINLNLGKRLIVIPADPPPPTQGKNIADTPIESRALDAKQTLPALGVEIIIAAKRLGLSRARLVHAARRSGVYAVLGGDRLRRMESALRNAIVQKRG